ncbi:alpha/beta hydrolase-fold protein [Winogradskyella sp. SYSU M77433]|uniref:alpha/beta hydrolase-fold protein n=1 Tax=Winogradskyella sp. SYSU M77433 TaxID=3042722 RepID=UPI00247FCE7D|nr:alpha/beta hydrolase-fold protein [Winogradskyella sp. SYSU M77433]MDH7913536.1 alpha/beta hydrolase-fold protein [Winogradskyella sp. SYSU M77433]
MKRTFSLIAILFTCIVSAQQYSGISKSHKIASTVFDTEREIRVFVPFSYTESYTQKYPTIYLFDAQFDAFFDMTAGLMDYMAQIGELNEFIVVGIKTEHRPKEFTPMYVNEKTKTDWEDVEIGKSELLENHLKEEVFPFVEQNYRVEPFKMAIGHSLGGTFVLNTVFSQPDFFQAIIAISPNLSYDYEQLIKAFDDYFKSNESLNKLIYMSAGTIGNMENRFRKSAQKLDNIIEYHNPEDLNYTFRIFEGENHSTTPIYTISNAFKEVAKIWTIPEDQKQKMLEDKSKFFVDDLKGFYAELSVWANYDVKPGVDEANGYGYFCLNAEKTEEALKVFDWALELYPNDANLYDSKAEALEKSNDLKQAKNYYKKAMVVLENTKDQYDPENYEYYKSMFSEHLENLKNKK